MNIVLRKLNIQDKDLFLKAVDYWKPDLYSFVFDWQVEDGFENLLKKNEDYEEGRNLPEGFVASTMLYAFFNNQIIGRVSIRHYLNENLQNLGNIGFIIHPEHRCKGYGSEILLQALEYCRCLYMYDVMLTCDDTNTASAKIIEKCKGDLFDKIVDPVDKSLTRRYLIKL